MALSWEILESRGRRVTRHRATSVLGAGAVLFVVSACNIDNRTLELAEAGEGGDGSGSNGGKAGSGSYQPPAMLDLPECDYSKDQVPPDCETIVDNAGFASGIEGWLAEPLAIEVNWEAGDAEGSDQSGSISVINRMHGLSNGVAPGGGMQCVPARPGEVFDIAGDVFIPEGQGEGVTGGPYSGQAGFSILFWPTDDCSDKEPSIANFQTPLVQNVGLWSRVEGSTVAPEKTGSMSVRVLTVKPFKQFSFKAQFDNVFVQKR
jgi:hypothetical protein